MRILFRARIAAFVVTFSAGLFAFGQSQSTSKQPAPEKPAAGSKPTKRVTIAAARPVAEQLNDVDAIGPLFTDPESRGPLYRDVLSYAKRNLRMAIQAGYDANLLVAAHAQADGQARLFRIQKGNLSHEPAAAGPSDAAIRLERFGRLSPANESEAFGLGLSFFIADPTFLSPTALRYTVVSDPSYQPPPNWAHELTEIVDNSGSLPLTAKRYNNSGFSSNRAPQDRVVTFGTPFNDRATGYLSIGWMSPAGLFQVESNEIDLAAVWKTSQRANATSK